MKKGISIVMVIFGGILIGRGVFPKKIERITGPDRDHTTRKCRAMNYRIPLKGIEEGIILELRNDTH
jgi:hypothetical protein